MKAAATKELITTKEAIKKCRTFPFRTRDGNANYLTTRYRQGLNTADYFSHQDRQGPQHDGMANSAG